MNSIRAEVPGRQLEGWSDRYEKARTWNVLSFRFVRDWLAANTPRNEGRARVRAFRSTPSRHVSCWVASPEFFDTFPAS